LLTNRCVVVGCEDGLAGVLVIVLGGLLTLDIRHEQQTDGAPTAIISLFLGRSPYRQPDRDHRTRPPRGKQTDKHPVHLAASPRLSAPEREVRGAALGNGLAIVWTGSL
jgi:hypothetical protein